MDRVNCLKSAETLQGESFLLTFKQAGISGTHLIDLGKIKSRVDLGATYFEPFEPDKSDIENSGANFSQLF